MKPSFCFLLFLTLLSSCSTVEIVRIDVEKPAQVTLPAYIQNIVVVNNAVIQPDSMGQIIKRNASVASGKMPCDSLNIILTQALAQFMDDEKFYNQVVAYDEPLRKDNLFGFEMIIESDKIRQISEETGADAVISLDKFIIISTLEYSVAFVAELTLDVQAKFRIYDGDGRGIGLPVVFRDTLCWNAWDYGDMMSAGEAARQAAIHVADKMVSMFIPFWQPQNRWFYTDSGREMREAAQKAMANKWKDAALLWGSLYDREEKPLKKAKIASNIALANEMLDDVENALIWADISYNLYEEYGNETPQEDFFRIVAFRAELKNRVSDFKKLDLQKGVSGQPLEKND
jgi:hypothetical protein